MTAQRPLDCLALRAMGPAAATLVTVWGGAAAALPTNPVVAGFNGSAPAFNAGPGALTVTQNGTRLVVNWSTFDIAHGESVTFNQPGSSSIAFNVLPAGVSSTISGSLTANGGVWVMAPGGVVFGPGATVNVGSLLASTGNFTATSVNQALNGNAIEIFPQSTVGAGSISVDPTASINASAGFVALQAPTIDQEGSITATDGVVLNAMEGMQVNVSPGAGGVLLQSETPTAPNGGSSSIAAGGHITAGWVELDAFNDATANPGVSGVINLTGHIDAIGMKPGTSDSVELVANFGAADQAHDVTTVNAAGAQIVAQNGVTVDAGAVNTGAWSTLSNSGSGAIRINAGPGGVSITQPLTTASSDIDLNATGPLSVAANLSSGGAVNLNGDTVALAANTTVASTGSQLIQAPDGFTADASSLVRAGDNNNDLQNVTIAVGSTLGPANLTTGQVAASAISLQNNAGLTRPAGGVANGPGDILLEGAITTSQFGDLFIDSYRSVAIDAPVNAQGSTSVSIFTDQGGANGDYRFGPAGSLSFTGAPGGGQSLNINGQDFTLVYSVADLLNVNNDLGGSYALANDIDFANTPNPSNPSSPQAVFFTASPIANTSELPQDGGGTFFGTFTGLGHDLSNLSVNQTIGGTGAVSNGEVGLFGFVDFGGVVRDINLIRPQVGGSDFMDVGALVGYLNGTIENVSVVGGAVTGGQGGSGFGVGGLVGVIAGGGSVLNSHSSASVTAGLNASVGGLAGVLTNGGAIRDAYATGDVATGDSNGDVATAGGLVGGTYSFPFNGLAVNSISDSYATGQVNGGAGSQVGGFIGEAIATTITTSYATGAVVQIAPSGGGQGEAGGFAGFVGGGASVTQSYASGAVTSAGAPGQTNLVGGFVGLIGDNGAISDSYALGSASASLDSVVGGFAGAMEAGLGGTGAPSITRVYATGQVSDPGGSKPVGGLVGDLLAGQFSNSFWDTGTTGALLPVGHSGGGSQSNLVAVGGAVAYAAATYAPTFDLANTWVIFDGQTRPMLRSEYSTSISNAHQLQLMALNLGATYTLAGDIDASETSSAAGVWNQTTKFDPVGATVATPFTGVLDGKGFTISNLAIAGSPVGAAEIWDGETSFGALGLIGVEGQAGSIRNVSIEHVTVSGGAGMDVGALVGIAEGAVTGSSSSGFVIAGGASGATPAAIGGLVGAADGVISNSSSSTAVQGTNSYAGGLVGWLAPGGAVESSQASGSVTVTDATGGVLAPAAGGLVGFAGSPTVDAPDVTITDSQAFGSVQAGAGAMAGGFAGGLKDAAVTSSFANGSVQAGLAGGAGSDAGGFAGYIVSSQVTADYGTGAVSVTAATSGTGGDAAGGFAGVIDSGSTVSESYGQGAVSATPGGSATLTTEAGGFAGAVLIGAIVDSDYASSSVTIGAGAPAATQSVAGGFAGFVSGPVSNIMAYGAVADGGHVGGGLIGELQRTGSATNGVWDVAATTESGAIGANVGGVTSGLASVGGASPSPYLAASYGAFDFANTWFIIPGETRPFLRAEYSTTIRNVHQLELMTLDRTASYTLGDDIDASETASASGLWNPANGFVPVGTLAASPFSGTLNGDGFTISNLHIIAAPGAEQDVGSGIVTFGAAGLFGFSTGSISNVTLTNVDVNAGDGTSAGALVGYQLAGSISDSSSSGSVTIGNNVDFGDVIFEANAGGLVGTTSGALIRDVSSAFVTGGEAEVGGLVGEMVDGSILNSYATGNVSVTGFAGAETPSVGGLVGAAFQNFANPTITGSFATGDVTAGSGSAAGGFIGHAQGATIGTSYATGTVTLTGNNPFRQDYVGGFAGLLTISQVTQSFASGAVTANVTGEPSNVGGFVGRMSGGSVADAYASGPVLAPNATDVGGFAGLQTSGSIQRVLAVGSVDPGPGGFVAGLVGSVSGGSVSDSYWDEGATGQGTGVNLNGGTASNVVGIGGGTDNDPALTSTYSAFDFGTPIWSTPSPGEYPQLYGVSHVLLMTVQDTSTVYADFPVFTVNEFGFQPLEGPSVVSGLSGGVVNATLSSSGHYVVTVNSSPYPIVFAGASATSPNGSGDYRFIYVDGQLTVTPRTIDPGLGNVVKTYDATTGANLQAGDYFLNGTIGGDDVSLDDPPTGPNSGTYDTQNVGTNIGVNVNGTLSLTGADAQNYQLSSTTIVSAPVGEIDPATLEISAAPDTKVYDATTSSIGAPFVVSGLQGDDTVTGLTQSFDSKNAGTRLLLVDPSFQINDGNDGGNYSVILDTANGTITPAFLRVAAVGDTKVYDGGVSSGLTPNVSGLQGSDTISNLSQVFDSKNAGSRSLEVAPGFVINDGNGGANYQVTVTDDDGEITPAPLEISAAPDSKVYDATTGSTGTPFVVGGLVGGDTVTGLTEIFDNKNAGTRQLLVSGYTINDGADGGNYAVSLDAASGSITPAPLTLSALPDTRVYNGTTGSLVTPTEAGLLGPDTISGLAEVFDSKNAGVRTLLVAPGYAINDGNDGGNYAVRLVSAVGSITPAPLTLSASDDTKVYDGGTGSTATPDAFGLFEGDTVTGLTEVYDSKNAGSRTLTVGPGFVVNDGNDGGNYIVTLTEGDGTITPAPLTLAAVGDIKVYDGGTGSTATPDALGLFAGDTVTGLVESFDSKNAGPRTLTVGPGFVINDGNDGGNYTVTLAAGDGTITPAPLVISAAPDSKVYDTTTGSTGTPFVVGGLVGGDTVSGLTEVFDSKNAGARHLLVNGYTISDGNGGANYAVTLDDAAGSITPAPLTLAAVGDGKVYDGSTGSTGKPIATGLLGEDTITGLTEAFDNKNAGERTLAVTNSYVISDGADGGNYAVSFVTAPGTITPKPLEVTLVGEVFKVFDGNTRATLAPSNYDLLGVVPGDQVTVNANLNGTYDTPDQGVHKLVTVIGLSLTGVDAGDYTVSPDASGPVGVICCATPPIYDDLLTEPHLLRKPAPFEFLNPFPINGDFPVAPDDDSGPKVDVFPVTGAGNRDLWTGPTPTTGDGGGDDGHKDPHP